LSAVTPRGEASLSPPAWTIVRIGTATRVAASQQETGGQHDQGADSQERDDEFHANLLDGRK